ncbi:MAG TPA: hypothetical protein DC006_04825 [Prevotellaceae bacterium]|nr:hypothetical protein [Prevotellaceae bacterium]
MKRYTTTPAGAAEPIRIEQVFAEKPGGGLVEDPGFDVPETTAVYAKGNGKYAVIKAYRLAAAVAKADTTLKIAKGSGIAVGDVLAFGKKGVACTAIDTSAADSDKVTVTMGVDIPAGSVLYQAKAESADAAVPVGTPVYVTGNALAGGMGEQPLRLVNGANLRKETACMGDDIAGQMKNITLV